MSVCYERFPRAASLSWVNERGKEVVEGVTRRGLARVSSVPPQRLLIGKRDQSWC